METIESSNVFIQPFESLVSLNEENCVEDEEGDQNQVTSQDIIDSLTRYTVRPNGAYWKVDCICEICYSKYNVGDKVVSLPCQHNFHEHCIENWLKWVKPTCPVDKKSVVRHRYMEDVINERRKQLLEAHALNTIIPHHSTGEENYAFCASDDESYVLDNDNNIGREALRRKQRCYQTQNEIEVQEIRTPQPQLLSPRFKEHTKSGTELGNSVASNSGFRERAKSNAKLGKPVTANGCPSPIDWSEKSELLCENNLENNEGNHDDICVVSKKYPQQVLHSVGAIRNSIHTKDLVVKKLKNSKKFEKDLDTVMAKLSGVRINSPEGKSSNLYKSKKVGRSLSPSKSRETKGHASLRGIMGKRSLTFGDMLELENEVNFCWIYKGNKEVTLPGRYSKKY